MEAGKRRLLEGSRYERLFPAARMATHTLKADAALSDTLKAMPEIVRKYGWQAKEVAKALKAGDLRQTCRNIWEFCYRHFQYRKDEDRKEQVRTPARAWADRKEGIDCDCFTVLASSILSNLGIRHFMRVAKYPSPDTDDPPFQHIYVTVPVAGGHITMDPVTDWFDHEVPFSEKIDIPITPGPMELQLLDGLPSGHRGGIDQLDLFGLGETPATTGSKKMERVEAEAKAKGMTVEQYAEWTRQEFTKTHGVTPEQWAAQIEAGMKDTKAASAAKEAEEMERLREEIRKRGAVPQAGATKQQLLDQLRQNPPPKTAGAVLNTVNKANPATVLLRSGLVLAMKTDLMGVAKKLRWAFTSREQAGKAGMGAADHIKVTDAWDRLRKIHFGAGGEPESLMEAILTGKGNEDRAVSGGGLSGVPLGEPVSATAALGAATAVITAIAAIVASVKNPEGAGGKGITATLPAPLPQTAQREAEPPPEEALRESGTPPEEEPKGKGIVGWVKANPLPAAGIGVAAAGLTYLAVKAITAKGGTALQGTPATKPPRKRGKSKAAQQVKMIEIP